MIKEQLNELSKLTNINMTEHAKDVINVATACCWQPLDIDINKECMFLGMYEGDMLKIIDKKQKLKVVFLPVDLRQKSFNETMRSFFINQTIDKLSNKYGPKGEKLINEAKQAIIFGDFDRASSKIRKASSGNPDYVKKQEYIDEIFENTCLELKGKEVKEEKTM